MEARKNPASNARRVKRNGLKELLAERHPAKARDADGV
jgi:hypothetical protein